MSLGHQEKNACFFWARNTLLLFLVEIVFLSQAYSDDISCFKMFWTFSGQIHGPLLCARKLFFMPL